MPTMSTMMAWAPFLCSSMTRVCIIINVVVWLERRLFGYIVSEVGSFAIYSALLFVGIACVRTALGSLTQAGPTPDMEVHSEVGKLREDSVPWAACGMRGWRPAMEDAHIVEMLDASVFPDVALCGVLDGHGGYQVSALASKVLAQQVIASARAQPRDSSKPDWKPSLAEALENSLPNLDAQMRSGPFGYERLLPLMMHPFFHEGSTACIAAVDFARQEIVTANIGDSRGILIRNGKAIALSEDHKPEDARERRRIENAGGRVIKVGPCWRVDGNLNLSRALGDFHLKDHPTLPPEKQKVSAFPDVTRTPYLEWPQELLVMGCDGLFERKENQDIADIVWPRFQKGMPLEQIGQELLHLCCAKSCRGQPMEMGTDNETAVIVKLPSRKAAPSEANGKCFLVGENVTVHGLSAEAAQDLNGQSVMIEGACKEDGRYDVRFNDGTVKSIKVANLQRPVQEPVKVSQDASKAD